jgi:hypothetical protein
MLLTPFSSSLPFSCTNASFQFCHFHLSTRKLSVISAALSYTLQMSSTRIFALIIGIDTYKSGNIWNLHACVEDARKMKRWLVEKLNVPRGQIRLLLDHHATKSNIEDSFMEHLVNNPSIEPGDAILIYFAGHGSRISAPPDWYETEGSPGLVEVICPFDHDTKASQGRVAGISDRSLHAMVEDLAACKGDNITLFLDCCFSPVQTPANIIDRSITRWTRTPKAVPEDLYRGLWSTARGKFHASDQGFFLSTGSHVLLAASCPGQKATESKEGGRFTVAFLQAVSDLPLHRTSYEQLIDHLREQVHDDPAQYSCFGKHKHRILFDDVPFPPDSRFTAASIDDETRQMKIEVGAMHGIVEGSEFSLHLHNYRHSQNLPIGTVVVVDVRPSWCLARVKSQLSTFPKICWAQVTKWNNSRPFCIYLKSTLISFFRMWKLRKSFPTKFDATRPKNEAHVLRVNKSEDADISLTVDGKGVVVYQNSTLPASNSHMVMTDKDPKEVIDDAVRFNLHLFRNNVLKPFQNLIDMEIWRIDPLSWSKISDNYLENGTAIIPHERGAIFQIILRNNSKIDLWPYIVYMDPNRYTISTVYSSDSRKEAPLLSQGSLQICSGQPGSEALTFSLDDHTQVDRGFLKVFLSSVPVSMKILEQGSRSCMGGHLLHPPLSRPIIPLILNTSVIWDTALASLIIVRHPVGKL